MQFQKGWETIHEIVRSKPFTFMCCYNCKFLDIDEDGEETCHNPNVLGFDVRVEETRVFCNQWEYASCLMQLFQSDYSFFKEKGKNERKTESKKTRKSYCKKSVRKSNNR